MADLAGARVITEDELDSTTLGNAIEEILGTFTLLPEVAVFRLWLQIEASMVFIVTLTVKRT